MKDDFTPKECAEATGLSERTVRRRLHLYRRALAGDQVTVAELALAIPYRIRLGVPYRIPAEVVDALQRVETIT